MIEGSYSVNVYNEVQGQLCVDEFQALAGDDVLARTYNILPNDKMVYKMDTAATIVLEIPETLLEEGRTFFMLCVTEDGKSIKLSDLDKEASTITVKTDSFYAFALCYTE
ncbi:MAG: hypothetical protein R3Y24_14380 [Eubacteriales bacterium]